MSRTGSLLIEKLPSAHRDRSGMLGASGPEVCSFKAERNSSCTAGAIAPTGIGSPRFSACCSPGSSV